MSTRRKRSMSVRPELLSGGAGFTGFGCTYGLGNFAPGWTKTGGGAEPVTLCVPDATGRVVRLGPVPLNDEAATFPGACQQEQDVWLELRDEFSGELLQRSPKVHITT